MDEVEFDFSLIKEAGLTQGEFAQLVTASRVSVNNWVKGGTPHKMYHPALTKQLLLLKAAIKTKKLPGKLPPVNRYNKDLRSEMIRGTLDDLEERLKKKARARRKSRG